MLFLTNIDYSVSESKLGLLIKNISFRKEPVFLYTIPGIFLSISLFAIVITLSIIFINILTGGDLSEVVQQIAHYSRFMLLYIGYVLLSAIVSYRYCTLVTKHLVDSGLTSYYWLREINDYDSIKILYATGLVRRNIPSPLTVLVLSIITGGLAYPFILYVLEKNLRKHCIGEESKFLNKKLTEDIDASNLLVDIILTIVTLGLYMVYLSSRLIRQFNKHIETIHSNHPHKPLVVKSYEAAGYFQYLVKSPVFLTSVLLLTTSLISTLQLLGVSMYFILPIVSGLYVFTISIIYSRSSFTIQVLYTLLAIYLSFTLAAAVGFTGFFMYYEILSYFKSIIEGIGRDPFHQLSYIFSNNLVISLLSLVPYLGSVYIGSGLCNAGLIYGVILADSVLLRGNYTPLLLFIQPHAFLELLAYSLFVSLSTRVFRINTSSFIRILVASIATLFAAAVVEVITIQLIH